MRRRTVMVVLAGTGLVAGACGDDDGTGVAASTSIEAAATEYEFAPDTWAVPEGEELTIAFTNDGTIEHEWAVLKLGEDIESESELDEDKVLFEVEAVPAGESATETFTVDEAGSYQVICAIPSHFTAGMEGTLTVE